MRAGIILLMLLALCQTNCSSRQKHIKQNMERFNIEYFERHAVDDEQTETIDDGSVITRLRYAYGFTERIVPRGGYFDTYKEFHPNGNLRTKGLVFKKGGFKAGKWPEYEENGSLEKETNYDAPYKLDVAQVLDMVRQRKISFSMTDSYSKINRNILKGTPTWVVEWKEQPSRMERLFIEDATARVVKQDFYQFVDNQ